jgi:hypothetical protein
MKRVVVHIDRLVLSGFRPDERRAVAAGLEAELRQAFSEPALALRVGATGNVASLAVRRVQIERGAWPRRVGQHVARGIVQEMKR